jgi:hypothetical protein
VEDWREVSPGSLLAFVDNGEHLRLFDTRPVAQKTIQTLTGLERSLYLACDAQQSLKRLAQRFAEFPVGQLKSTLDGLVEAGWMVAEDGRYLSLAVDMSRFIEPERRRLAPDGFCLAVARGMFCEGREK